jgi:hypothetical protein
MTASTVSIWGLPHFASLYVKAEEKRRMKAVKKFWEARAGR